MSLGAKIGQFGSDSRKSAGTSRDKVYSIFELYEQWKAANICPVSKRQRTHMYDRMDVVHDINRRLLKMPYKQRGVLIHAISVDEVRTRAPQPGWRTCFQLEVKIPIAAC